MTLVSRSPQTSECCELINFAVWCEDVKHGAQSLDRKVVLDNHVILHMKWALLGTPAENRVNKAALSGSSRGMRLAKKCWFQEVLYWVIYERNSWVSFLWKGKDANHLKERNTLLRYFECGMRSGVYTQVLTQVSLSFPPRRVLMSAPEKGRAGNS